MKADKSIIRKFIDKITGKQKVDAAKLDLLEDKNSILADKIENGHDFEKPNYSIKKMIIDIDVYLKQNQDNQLISQELEQLKELKSGTLCCFGVDKQFVKQATERKLNQDLANNIQKNKEMKGIFKNKKILDNIQNETEKLLANNKKETNTYFKVNNKHLVKKGIIRNLDDIGLAIKKEISQDYSQNQSKNQSQNQSQNQSISPIEIPRIPKAQKVAEASKDYEPRKAYEGREIS